MSDQIALDFEKGKGSTVVRKSGKKKVRRQRTSGPDVEVRKPKAERGEERSASASPKILVGRNPALETLLPTDFLTMTLGTKSNRGAAKLERVAELANLTTVGQALSVGTEHLSHVPGFGGASMQRWEEVAADLTRLGRVVNTIRAINGSIKVPGTPYEPIDYERSLAVGYRPRAIIMERGPSGFSYASFRDNLPDLHWVFTERPRISLKRGIYTMKIKTREVLGVPTIPLYAWLVIYRLADSGNIRESLEARFDLEDPRSIRAHGDKKWNRLRYDDRYASHLPGVPTVKGKMKSITLRWRVTEVGIAMDYEVEE